MVRGHRGGVKIALCGAVFFACLAFHAQEQPPPNPQTPHAVFVFLQRTSGHVKYSTPQVFQTVVEDVFAHLKSINVSMASDEFGGRRYSEEEMTLEAVRKIARDSKADSLLYLIVDRPKTHWIRVVAQCYNSPGELLWREEATERLAITGGQGLRTTLHKLHQRLDQHVGQEGLPLVSGERAKGEHQK